MYTITYKYSYLPFQWAYFQLVVYFTVSVKIRNKKLAMIVSG